MSEKTDSEILRDMLNRQIDVVDRLSRIEAKMDIQNGTVKKVCSDVDVLQHRADVGDAQWGLIKKAFAVTGGIVVSIAVPVIIALISMGRL